jgi:hypothetical protein
MKENDSFFLILLTMLFSFIISLNPLLQYIFASPPVVRQEVQDKLNDWQITNNTNYKNCIGIEKNVTFPDIGAVSYFSNGKSLNSTVWLSSYLDNLSSVLSLKFDMAIHIHSVYSGGPINYHYTLLWDNFKNKWVQTLDEQSWMGTEKRLEENYNYSLDPGNNYINFNLDLDKISNPDEYSLFVSEEIGMKKGHYTCYLIDPSYRVNIPPPPVTISESPNPLILKPGEKKIVEVAVKSPTLGFNPLIYLSATNNSNIQLKFLSNFIPLPATYLPATISTPLEVKVNENASIHPYSIPINASMTNPLEQSTQTVLDVKNRTQFSPIKDNPPLAVIVNEPLTSQENFESFWKVYGGIISLIGGGFIAGIASILIDRIRNKRKTKPNFEDW